jgi:RHS repeat-associated protein
VRKRRTLVLACPYGEIMREWKHADLDKHRYGYQGDFAEKDWATFVQKQASLTSNSGTYDSKIGRWLVPDPMRQFASPYVGMGNDPINGVLGVNFLRLQQKVVLQKVLRA